MGFAPYFGLGVAFSRDSSASLFLDLRIAQNLIPLEVHDGWDGEQFDGFECGQKIFPTELGVRLGIQF